MQTTNMTTQTQPTTAENHRSYRPDPDAVRRILAKRSFATVGTTSPAGRPHVAGVLYELVGNTLYFHTMRNSRKARNIAADAHTAVCVPVRRVPVGPPSTVHFQTTARLVEPNSMEIRELVADGKLGSVTGHGELDEPAGCFIAVSLPGRVLTYGLGMSLRQLIKDPLVCGGEVTFGAANAT